MPVKAEDAAEGLEPIRVRQSPQDFFSPEFTCEEDHDLARKRNHPLEQIARRFAAVQREMREPGAGHCGDRRSGRGDRLPFGLQGILL